MEWKMLCWLLLKHPWNWGQSHPKQFLMGQKEWAGTCSAPAALGRTWWCPHSSQQQQVRGWHISWICSQSADKETQSALAGSRAALALASRWSYFLAILYHQDQHATEKETQRQASKDKVTVLAISKERNRNDTSFCPNGFIILKNFVLWVSLRHW